MATHLTYYLVDLVCLLFPFLFSFHPKIRFYRQWKSFFAGCLLAAVFFIVWDIFYTALGVWSFNADYTGAIRFVNLPVEEMFFFFCVPYACVFTYHCLRLFIPKKRPHRFETPFSLLLMVILLLVAALNVYRIYTSVTCFLLALWIGFLLLNKATYLGAFYRLYALILIPFLFSNGILTGSWIDEPVVMYNDAYNLGWRILTIPVEDVFYGMLLILMNVSLFEFFEARGATNKNEGISRI